MPLDPSRRPVIAARGLCSLPSGRKRAMRGSQTAVRDREFAARPLRCAQRSGTAIDRKFSGARVAERRGRGGAQKKTRKLYARLTTVCARSRCPV
jgi:hypothetical protein